MRDSTDCRRRQLFGTFVMLVAAGCGGSPTDPKVANSEAVPSETAAEPTAVQHVSIDLEILDHAGLKQRVAEKRGRVVILDCWSTWCPPCIKEFPNLVALYGRYDKNDLACISASLDYDGLGRPEDRLADVRAFLEKHEATFDNVLCAEDDVTMYEKLGVNGVPAVFVYDRDGSLAKRFGGAAGEFSYQDVEDTVKRLIDQ